MNSIRFQHSPNYDYPAIELDMTDFLEHLSEEYMCGKVDVRDDPKIIECKIEDCTEVGEVSCISTSGLEQKERVRQFNIEFVTF